MRHRASIFVALMLFAARAHAQSTPIALPRVDVAAATGWFMADRSIQEGCCSSWSAGLFKGISAGYYWTEHLKTEVELAAPGETESYTVISERLASNLFRYTNEEHTVTARRFSLSQAYQFGHNSNFHPFVRGGVDIDRERDEIERRISISNTFQEEHRETSATRARPFAAAGFKAYFNERTFFKGEARFTPMHGGINQMVWTAGLGIDLGGSRRSTRPAAHPTADTATRAVRAPEPIDRWREYASKLPIGERIDLTTAGGRRLVADLVSVDGAGLTVKPVARVPEPVRQIPFDQLEQLARHTGPRPGTRVGAAIAGAGTGLGVFMALMAIAFAVYGD